MLAEDRPRRSQIAQATALFLAVVLVVVFVLAAVERFGALAWLAMAIFPLFVVPRLLIVAGILLDAVLLVLHLLSPSTATLASAAVVPLALVGLALLLPRSRTVRQRVVSTLPGVLLILLIGGAIGIASMPMAQVLIGMRIVIGPIVVFLAAPAFARGDVEKVTLAAGWLILASNIAAIWQMAAGVGVLQSMGLVYGASLRTVDSVLRPPGLFVASYVYGGFASVVAVLLLARLFREGPRRVGFVWILLTLAAVVGVVLSTSRFALIVTAAGILGAILASSREVSWSVRVASIGASAAAAFAFLTYGLTSNESWYIRLAVWRDALGEGSSLLGNGWGSAGSATLSSFSTGARIVDSYFINLYIQIGVLTVVAVIWLVVLVAQGLRARSQASIMRWAGACAGVGLIASFTVTETWEYYGAASMVMLALGSAGVSVEQPLAILAKNGERLERVK